MFRNPVTNEQFENEEEYAQSLIDAYAEAKRELFRYAGNEGVLVEALNKVAEGIEPGLKRGTITVMGVTKVAKIGRKVNVTYEKARGESHPLRRLIQDFEGLSDKVRVDYKESGQAIQALMDRHAKGDYQLDDDAELAGELAKVRKEKAAKPSINVEDKIDVAAGKDAETPTF